MCYRHAAKKSPWRKQLQYRQNIRPQFMKKSVCTKLCSLTGRTKFVLTINNVFFRWFQVGRALAPSILDLTDSNPLTRLRNSEFRSLQGLRNSLRNEIERHVVVPRNITAMPKVSDISYRIGSDSIFHLIFFSNGWFDLIFYVFDNHRSGYRIDVHTEC